MPYQITVFNLEIFDRSCARSTSYNGVRRLISGWPTGRAWVMYTRGIGFLHVELFQDRPVFLKPYFLRELPENPGIANSLSLVDTVSWVEDILFGLCLRFHHEIHGNWKLLKYHSEVKNKNYPGCNHFWYASVTSAEAGLDTFDCIRNQRN